jgi:Ni/Co efflux regulator RcnB
MTLRHAGTLLTLLALTAAVHAAEPSVSAAYMPKPGTQVPARFATGGLTETQMAAAGLKAPAPGNRWIKMDDKYVEVRTSDGTVQSIEAAVK